MRPENSLTECMVNVSQCQSCFDLEFTLKTWQKVRREEFICVRYYFWRLISRMRNLLSIQSAVAAGFVGNSVAGPALIALGHRPLLVDTVALAAHPGYGTRAGGAMAPQMFAEILGGIETLVGFEHLDGIITGYLGNAGQVDAISQLIAKWRATLLPTEAINNEFNPSPKIYVLDPVLGDAGRLYVTPDLATAIANQLVPVADIITPNQFELGYLTNTEVNDRETANAAARELLAKTQLQAVVTTGISSHIEVGDLLTPRQGDAVWQPVRRSDPKTSHNVAGGGDLLTALLSGHLCSGMGLADAFVRASKQAQSIIAASPTTRDLALLENLHLIQK